MEFPRLTKGGGKKCHVCGQEFLDEMFVRNIKQLKLKTSGPNRARQVKSIDPLVTPLQRRRVGASWHTTQTPAPTEATDFR